jgi:hypothetical protein
VVGIFPSPKSTVRLIGALLLEPEPAAAVVVGEARGDIERNHD